MLWPWLFLQTGVQQSLTGVCLVQNSPFTFTYSSLCITGFFAVVRTKVTSKGGVSLDSISDTM